MTPRLSTGLLVCVYTCKAHEALMPRFLASAAGVELSRRPDVLMLEVHADPTVPESVIVDGKMLLRANERYEELSLKTHRMIELAVDEVSFDSLLKIDVTTVMTQLDSPEYANRQPMDMQAIAQFLSDADYRRDYFGFLQHVGAGREGAENWARKKDGRIDYERLFGQEPMPPFYSGKCYVLSRAFAEFIARHGAPVAEEQKRYFMGSEDVMVGRLYQQFLQVCAA